MRTSNERPSRWGWHGHLPAVVAAMALVVPVTVSGSVPASAAAGAPRPQSTRAGEPDAVRPALAMPAEGTSTVRRKTDTQLVDATRSQAAVGTAALGTLSYRSGKSVAKTLLPSSKVKTLAKSKLLAGVSVASTSTKKNFYKHLETRRMFKSRIYSSRSKAGAVPVSIAVVQLDSPSRATDELIGYIGDAARVGEPTSGGKNYNVTSTTVTHLFVFRGVKVSQSVKVTGSAVIVAVCQKAKGHRASPAQLNRCSQNIAREQSRRSASLFTVLRDAVALAWTPTVSTDSSAGCALTQPSDPTTLWCALGIVPLVGGVNFDQVVALSAKYGTVSQGEVAGKLAVRYVPKSDGPYVDTIRYSLRNSTTKVQAPAGTITLTVNKNGNYSLSTIDESLQMTPEVFSAAFPTCALSHPADPSTLEWCRSPISLSDFGLVSGTSGIYYDRIQAQATMGYGTVQTDFAGGEGTIYFKPNRNGLVVESITYRVGNSKLGVWSNTSTITLTVLRNTNYAPGTP